MPGVRGLSCGPPGELVDVRFLEQQLLVLYNEEGSAAPACVRVQADLLQADVVHDADLRVDVDLSPQLSQRAHEHLRVTMDAHPRPIHKHLGGDGDHRGGYLLQVLARPLLQKLQNGRGARAHRHVCHQRQVFHEATRLTFRRFGRADHALQWRTVCGLDAGVGQVHASRRTQCELWSWRGFASFPSRPMGEFSRRRCDRVDA
eukprot:scaffold3740_cov322-Prasinococcus_capsulatus_cf.AAC.3